MCIPEPPISITALRHAGKACFRSVARTGSSRAVLFTLGLLLELIRVKRLRPAMLLSIDVIFLTGQLFICGQSFVVADTGAGNILVCYFVTHCYLPPRSTLGLAESVLSLQCLLNSAP